MNSSTPSPFHSGEQWVQSKLGVREQMERFGQRVIRDHMPDQHREFYQKMPYIFVGHADTEGWPWASILFGEPGFMATPSDKQLHISAQVTPGDPLGKTLDEVLNSPSSPPQTEDAGVPLGLLGVELSTRRRNRLAGRATQISKTCIEINIDQSFGNCPQYIQSRSWSLPSHKDATANQPNSTTLNTLDEDAIKLIAESDTFFVSSFVAKREGAIDNSGAPSEGVDISHRGGLPGFVRHKITESGKNLLTIPDYLGNFHFNTLGNFVENPKAGLLFVDFEQGHLLMLSGTVEILWDSEEAQHFEGAERLWTFELSKCIRIKNALPATWGKPVFSPNTQLTGTWQEAEEKHLAALKHNAWQSFEVVKCVDESDSIRSFYLHPLDGVTAAFKAGQFLTLRCKINDQELVRTYTVSSAPSDNLYRISVKRDGEFSQYLHREIELGAIIEAKAPRGHFAFDEGSDYPTILMAAGVGITPMLSMMRHSLIQMVRTRQPRTMVLVVVARNRREQAFQKELSDLATNSGGHFQIVWCLTQPETELRLGHDFHFQGRPTLQQLKEVLPHSPCDVYLCGPDSFMQSSYNNLLELGHSDTRIFAEAFGPSSLNRVNAKPAESIDIAEEAIVTVLDEGGQQLLEQAWTKNDGSLLDFVEAHGLNPSYGCRSGQCGSCIASLESGEVGYDQDISATLADQEILLCCAKPLPGKGASMAKVKLKWIT